MKKTSVMESELSEKESKKVRAETRKQATRSTRAIINTEICKQSKE